MTKTVDPRPPGAHLLDRMTPPAVLQRARRAFDDRARQAGSTDASPAEG